VSAIRELLEADGGSVARPLLSASNDLIDVIGRFLRAGGDPADVERTLSAIGFMAQIHVDAAKRIRGRVRDLAGIDVENVMRARCFARPKPIEIGYAETSSKVIED
jgi:hypothetical protein